MAKESIHSVPVVDTNEDILGFFDMLDLLAWFVTNMQPADVCLARYHAISVVVCITNSFIFCGLCHQHTS